MAATVGMLLSLLALSATTATAAPTAIPQAASQTAPPAPTIDGSVVRPGQVTIKVTSNGNGGRLLTGYTVTSSPGNFTCQIDDVSRLQVGGECTVTGLTNGTAYTFTATASNDSGTSAPSPSSAPITPALGTVPSAPTQVTATAQYRSAHVWFYASDSDGGSNITSYTVTSSPSGRTCQVSPPFGPILGCTVPGLVNGVDYTFHVTATNAAGTSAPGAYPGSLTPHEAGVPSPPQTVYSNALYNSVYVTIWQKAEDSTGGSEVTGYRVTASGPVTRECQAPAPDAMGLTACTVAGLTAGREYTFTVRAINAVGESAPSAPSDPATPLAPTAPDPPEATAVAADGGALVTLRSSGGDGGSPIIAYTVTSTPGNVTCRTERIATGTAACEVSGLTNGSSYTFTATATNALGESQPGSPSNPVTPSVITAPDAPVNVTADVWDTTATVSFSSGPHDGGWPLTHFTATSTPGNLTCTYRDPESSGSLTGGSCVIRGLTPGVDYTFTVYAYNDFGPSSSSAPWPVRPPGAPTALSATPLVGAASVAFTPPSADGGAAITNYEYAVRSDGGTWGAWTPFSPALTASPVTIPDLANATTHQLKLRAVNSVGPGAESAPTSVTTPSAPRPAPPGSVFVPLDPARVYDSRSAGPNGAPAPLETSSDAAPKQRLVSVAAVPGGAAEVVPAGAVAVAYNLTVPRPLANGHLRVMPGDVASTTASAINVRVGETIANGLVVKLDADRQIKVENRTGAPTHAVVDVVGYFISPKAAPSGGRFTATTPTRVYDSNADPGGQVGPGTTRSLSVADQPAALGTAGQVVPPGALAIAYNITVVGPAAVGHLRVFPGDQESSSSSTINWTAPGDRIANGLQVRIAADRTIKVFNSAGVPVRFLIDVLGYYKPDSGALFYPVDPVRAYDSRAPQPAPGQLGTGLGQTLREVAVTDGRDSAGGVTTTDVVPAGAVAIAASLTAISPVQGAAGHLRVFPAGTPLVGASAINWPGAGYTRANGLTVAISADLKVSVYNGSVAGADAVLDTLGYYASNDAVAVTAGGMHTCGLVHGGAVKCWGYNGFGQLGDGTRTNSLAPVNVTGLTDAVALGAGVVHTCAIVGGGTVRCWGDNQYGQLGDGTSTGSLAPVSVKGITGATALAAGEHHTCAIVGGGTVRCWGDNQYGQLGDGTRTGSLAPVSVKGITGATRIIAGHEHTCAIVGGGAVKCWGQNQYGQLGDGTDTNGLAPVTVTGLTGAVALGAGVGHTCAIVGGGAVKCWGWNYIGQLGDGSLNSWSPTPVTVTGLTGATTLTAGALHTCAIVGGGNIKCWGFNGSGELGDGTYAYSRTPVTVTSLTGAVALGAGDGHTCAVVGGGAVKCWGVNPYGQLGDGSYSTRNTPVDVVGFGPH